MTFERQVLGFRYIDDRVERSLKKGPPDLWWNWASGFPEDDATGPSREQAAVEAQASVVFKVFEAFTGGRIHSGVGPRSPEQLTVGGEHTVVEPANNRGGLSEGVLLEIGGSALESGLIELKRIVLRNDHVSTEHPLTYCPEWPQQFAFMDFVVGPGPTERAAFSSIKGARAEGIESAREVLFALEIIGVKKGKGELTIWLRSPNGEGKGRLRRVPIQVDQE